MEIGVFEILMIVAIVLAAIDIINARGRAFTSWAVVVIAAALLLL